MPTFKEFYTNYEQHKVVAKKKKTEEDIFESVVGKQVSNVNSFIAWLVLNEHIKSYIKTQSNKKPISVYNLPADKKMFYLVKNLSNISNLVEEFNKNWD